MQYERNTINGLTVAHFFNNAAAVTMPRQAPAKLNMFEFLK